MRRSIGALGVMLTGAAVAVVAWTGTQRSDNSPAAATKKSVAAVAVDVLDLNVTSFDVNSYYEIADPLGVEIRFRPDGAKKGSDYLYVSVTPQSDRPGKPCDEFSECDTWTTKAGHFNLIWQREVPEEDPGIVVLTLTTPSGEERAITYAGEQITRDPRKQKNLQISVDDMQRLLTGARFSATTTQDMVDADLKKWPKDDTAGDPVATTPEIIGDWMRSDGLPRPLSGGPADTSAYGAGAVGAQLQYAKHSVTVVLVPASSDKIPTCGSGWHCKTTTRSTGANVTTGWRKGEAIVIRPTFDAVAIATVRSTTITSGPPTSGAAGRAYAAMLDSYSTNVLTTTKAYAAESRNPW